MSAEPIGRPVPPPAWVARAMARTDLAQVSQIEARIFPFPWTYGNFADSLAAGYDGWVFESLDDRKKENLLMVIRRYAELGLQPIITLIDSDLPVRTVENESVFGRDEIVLSLHDENEQGRLFKMKAW